jgi:hypothetical protein
MLAVQGWCVANCMGQSGGTEQSIMHLVTYTQLSLAMKGACSSLAAGMTKVGPPQPTHRAVVHPQPC